MCAVICPLTAVKMPMSNWTDLSVVDSGNSSSSSSSGGGGSANVLPARGAPVDDSLTSLNWLHTLNIMGEIQTTTPPTPPASPGPLGVALLDSFSGFSAGGPSAGPGAAGLTELASLRRFGGKSTSADSKNNSTTILHMGPPTCGGSHTLGGATAGAGTGGGGGGATCGASLNCRKNRAAVQTCHQVVIDDVDYKSNGDVKPPYSYATLICMAMKANKNKMSLSAIYKWIRDNFMYYRREDTGWQNSIRHNLSLNKCFIKVPRNKDEPGKGGFWRLDPKYAEEMADGTFKKRRISNRPSVPKVKVERGSTTTTTTTTTTISPTATAKKNLIAGVNVDHNAHHAYYLPLPAPQLQPPTGPTSMSELEASLLPLTSLAPHLVPAFSRSPLHLALDDEAETEAATSSLKGDFCWNSVLNEDIELDGLRYKTLDIVDMDVVANDIAAYHRTPLSSLQQIQMDGDIDCLDSPALSLDADDLLVNSDGGASNDDLSGDNLDLAIHVSSPHVISTQDWWRLTMAAVEGSLNGGGGGGGGGGGAGAGGCISMANVASTINGHQLGSPDYDLAEVAAANFLGNVWDDATRPALTGTFDLDGLVDLDGY